MDLFSYISTAEPLYKSATLGTGQSGHSREVAVVVCFKKDSMYGLSAKKGGRCREVAVSGSRLYC